MLAEEEQTNENQRTAMNSTDRVENETKKKQTTQHMVRLRRKPTVVGALENLLETIGFHRKSAEAGKTKVTEKHSMIRSRNQDLQLAH
jgi:hypothetical protein